VLTAAGWVVYDSKDANITTHPGVAIREFRLKKGHGFADYIPYVDGKVAGVVEAKEQGATLVGVEMQSAKYTVDPADALPAWRRPLPFAYESTGLETRFTNGLDILPRSRATFAFHRPDTLADCIADAQPDASRIARQNVSKERDVVERGDSWTTTSNKQLNFVQHVKTLLKQNGRAAVIVPDTVLFEGGAGETIRRKLLHECDVHTLLRLPTGLFYAQGVKANVLFFDKKPAYQTPWTKKLWIYDLRTNKHFTLKTNPLKREDLDESVACYGAGGNRHARKPTWFEQNPDGRWRAYDYDELAKRDKVSLDIFWLRDESLSESDHLPEPGMIAAEIVADLEAALEQFRLIAEDLEPSENVQTS